MNAQIRRFTAAVSLTLMLAAVPAAAAPWRTGDAGERSSIVRVITRMLQKVFGVRATAEPTIPIPGGG